MQPRGPLSHASSNARLHESSPVVVQKDPPASKIGFSKTLWFQAYLEKKELNIIITDDERAKRATISNTI